MDEKALARFTAKYRVNEATGCWEWTAATNWGGYGVFGRNGGSVLAHRVSYIHHRGGPPADRPHLDHLCRVRHCVNPDHLDPVTPAENCRRGVSHQAAKTECPYGHPYTPENTYLHDGKRACKACRRDGRPRSRPSKTHCPQGHEYTPENTYIQPGNGYQKCRECNRERAAKLRATAADS